MHGKQRFHAGMMFKLHSGASKSKESREKSRCGLSLLGCPHKTRPRSGNKQAKRAEGSIAREEEGNEVGNVGDFPLNSSHISQPSPWIPLLITQPQSTTAHLSSSSSFLCFESFATQMSEFRGLGAETGDFKLGTQPGAPGAEQGPAAARVRLLYKHHLPPGPSVVPKSSTGDSLPSSLTFHLPFTK